MYPTGIVSRAPGHAAHAGLFDVSHMGRFGSPAGGRSASSNMCSPTMPPPSTWARPSTRSSRPRPGSCRRRLSLPLRGGRIPVVVNAANREKDWDYLQSAGAPRPARGRMTDLVTARNIGHALASGPASRATSCSAARDGSSSRAMRNELSQVAMAGVDRPRGPHRLHRRAAVLRAVHAPPSDAPAVWDLLVEKEPFPVAWGRGTPCAWRRPAPVRPRVGHRPRRPRDPLIFSSPLALFAVSFSPVKGDFVGRAALLRQHAAYRRILARDYSLMADLPRITRTVAAHRPGVARAGSPVPEGGRPVGWVTSGTMVPYWKTEGEGLSPVRPTSTSFAPSALALLDSDVLEDDRAEDRHARQEVEAVVVPYHLRSDAPPYARPIVYAFDAAAAQARRRDDPPKAAAAAPEDALENHRWRQQECINLIPSEMTTSPLVRLLSVMDPAFRYAEHRKLEAFYDERRLLLPGHRLHRRGGAAARSRDVPLPGLQPRRRPG